VTLASEAAWAPQAQSGGFFDGSMNICLRRRSGASTQTQMEKCKPQFKAK
jgi:hypothetical protein